ncbi:Ulp1 family isopeptidase [Mesorhizobium amorphae]|uniref:Ulp1 family isopeptidase n=1 Tax=Mesorhizobium amorphae TaxID=71433 RepID=UPI0024E0BC99|nr:Ulp1 family isopeptidase [Mesorhizobium amorphae]
MNPAHFNPNDPAVRQTFQATQQQQGGGGGQNEFEQHLHEAGQAEAVPAATVPAAPVRNYPHLSDEDRNLIDTAIKAEVAGRDLNEATFRVYKSALSRLGNQLGSQGKTLSELDHTSLAAFVKTSFPRDGTMLPALTALRRQRDPNAPANARLRNEPSVEDKSLIERALQAGATRRQWRPVTTLLHARHLRALSKSLGPEQTITALDHDSLVAHVVRSFEGRERAEMTTALGMLRDYRERGDADLGPPHYVAAAEGGRLPDDVARVSGRPEPAPATAPNIVLHDSILKGPFGTGGVPSPALAANPTQLRRGADQPEQLIPAKRQKTLGNAQGYAIGRPLSEGGNSSGRVQPSIQQLISSREAPPPHAGGGEAVQGASALQPGHSTTVGSDRRPLYSDDASLIEDLRAALFARGNKDSSVRTHVNCLLAFSRWLFQNDKQGIAPRLHDPSLDDDVLKHQSSGVSSSIVVALRLLRACQADGALPRKRRAGLAPYPGDVALIKEYKSAAPGSGVSPQTVMAQGSTLNSFSHYLRENNRPGIAGRLHDDKSLDEDVERYRVTDKRIRPAIANLRKALPRGEGLRAGVMPAGARKPPLHPAAVAVPSGYRPGGAPLPSSRPGTLMPQPWGRAMGPAGAVPTQAMAQPAASNVQLLHQIAPMNLARPTAPQATSDIYGDLESFVELPSTPQVRRPAAPPATPDIYRDLESFVDLPSTPQARRPAAPPATSDIYRDLASFVDLPSTPQVRRPAAPPATPDIYRDLESFVDLPSTPQVWRPAAPPATPDIYRDLESFVDLPSTPQVRRPAAPPATPDIYRDLESFVDLPSTPQVRRPAAPPATPDIYRDLESFVDLPSTPQARRHAAPPATPDIYRDLESFVELPSTPQVRRPAAPQATSDIYGGPKSVIEIPSTPQELRDDAQSAPVPARSGAQAGAVAPTPRLHHSVPELGAVDWLSDEHITTDFLILRHELRASNPALAARMRFVDPLVAQLLRAGPLGDAERHFQAIVRGQADNDTADFLFLPVNDASTMDPDNRGNHWSLLLVDRRDRARPVAYHYDSIRGYHDVFAQQLAQRFGAPLEQPGMAQQPNSYDCGVYLVEGARELVRRLAQRQAPAVLNLDNLVVDRAAAQNRLRH